MEWFLRTDRLLVRGFTLEDLDPFYAYRNDPKVARWQGWSIPYSRRDAETLVNGMARADLFRPGHWTQLAIEAHGAAGLIGDLGVRREPIEPTIEIGITLSQGAQGHGYGTEALDGVVTNLFGELEVARVIAIAHEENLPVLRLLERTGFGAVAVDGRELIFSRLAPA